MHEVPAPGLSPFQGFLSLVDRSLMSGNGYGSPGGAQSLAGLQVHKGSIHNSLFWNLSDNISLPGMGSSSSEAMLREAVKCLSVCSSFFDIWV